MTDHDALLRAIAESPAEDTPRLVFADWLDEHADALNTPAAVRRRAAFIRDDISFSRLDEYDPLRLRWELIEKPRRETEPWAPDALPPVPGGVAFVRRPLFRRGFPWALAIESRGQGTVPDPPAGAFPLAGVRFVACANRGIDLLRRVGWQNRLTELEFERGGRTSVTEFHRLFALHLARLERLTFSQQTIDRRELPALTASAVFRRLAALTITNTPVGGAFVEALDRLDAPTALRELQIVGCRLNSAAVATLLDAPAACALQTLALGGDRIGAPEKFRALSRARTPPPLRALDVSSDAPGGEGLEEFLASPLVPGLRRLVLGHCSLGARHVRLIAAGAFDSLRVLDLSGNSIGNYGAAAIARAPHLAGLRVLDLGHCMVGDEGARALLESPLAEGLVLLDLTGSPASAETKELLKAKMGDRVRLDRA